MSDAVIIKGLTKTYKGGLTALRGVDLVVKEGEFFALLGPNGAGKTTIIGILTGLVNKTSGNVSIFGNDLDTSLEKVKQCIGVVPQEFNFDAFGSLFDTVVNQGGFYGLSRKVALERALKYLTVLGLYEKRNHPARTLSGGMKRRLMIARALVHEPKLFILDEPTAGVDIELRRGMWDFLEGLIKEGKTIILTTHYLEEAEQLAEKVAVIKDGLIVAEGSVKELLGTLQSQTFVLDIAGMVNEGVRKALAHFKPVSVDSNTLEVTLAKGESLNQIVQELDRAGVGVTSMRNKTNRLEEFFVSITNK